MNLPTPDPEAAVQNRVTGDRLSVLWSTKASRGGCVLVRFDLPAGAKGTPCQWHRRLDETFTVLEGELEMLGPPGTSSRRLKAGDWVFVPHGTIHGFVNSSGAPVSFTTLVEPAGDFERFIRTWYGLANAGMTNADGIPRNPLHLALALQWADTVFVMPLAIAQVAAISVLAGLARLLGVDRSLARHSGME